MKRWFAFLLVLIMTMNCFVVSSAEGNKTKTTDNKYTKTFKNETKGGTLYIKDVNGNVLDKLKEGDEITYTYPSSKLPDEVMIEAVASDGYCVSSYFITWLLNDKQHDTCETVRNVNKKKYKRYHYLATAEYDEVFAVSFLKEGFAAEEPLSVVQATGTPDIDNPEVGDSFTGRARLTYNGKKTASYNGTGYITCTTGDFDGEQITLKNCASGSDHWAPQTGQAGTYTITITKIDKKTGKITCKVEWANDKATEGYQNLSGTFTYYHTFDGKLVIRKRNGEVAGSFVIHPSMSGFTDLRAVFKIYEDEKCTLCVDTVMTGQNGEFQMDGLSLDPGTYYIKEVEAPTGYGLNNTVFKVKVGVDSTKSVTVKNNILRAKIKGTKIDSKTGQSIPTKGLSLAGAKYGIYSDSACTDLCTTGTSDASGNIEFDIEYLGYGVYYAKEISAPAGYNLDTAVHKLKVDETLGSYTGDVYDHEVSFISIEDSKRGSAYVIKKSANEAITLNNKCYSLAGCKFQLTSMTTGEVIDELLVTNENGITQEIELGVGDYKVKEVEAPPGFLLNDEEKYITVIEDQPNSVEFYDEPSNDPVGVLLKKVDAETGTEVATGAGELAGAEYTFKYYDGQYTTAEQIRDLEPLRTWIFATDDKGSIQFRTSELVSGDEFYIDNVSGFRVIPLGTLTIQETKAPEGYLLDDTLYIQNITADSSGEIIQSYQTPISNEQAVRGDIKGVKASAGDNKRLANVPFKITSVENGESHIVVTNEDGIFDTSSSWSLHSLNTNRGETSKDGVWFGDISKLDDKMGALPYGSYIIEELPCEANEDKILLKPFEVAVTKNNEVVDLGTLVNEYKPVPHITTTATIKGTGLQVSYALSELTVVDKVDYIDLTKGEKYTLKGVAMDLATGKPVMIGSNQITAEKTFTAENTYGTEELEYPFNASSLAGKKIVWFEYLYHNGEEVANHTDLKDLKQTIHFLKPSISTSAIDRETRTREAYIAKETKIDDTVSYEDLMPDLEYTVKGVVMDVETGQPYLVDGKKVTSEKTFTAASRKGSIVVPFIIDSRKLAGKKLVWFEYLYYGDTLIAVHEDITDESQTITFKSPPEEEPPVVTNPPKTGDNMNLTLWLLLFLAAIGGFVLMALCLKKGVDVVFDEDDSE